MNLFVTSFFLLIKILEEMWWNFMRISTEFSPFVFIKNPTVRLCLQVVFAANLEDSVPAMIFPAQAVTMTSTTMPQAFALLSAPMLVLLTRHYTCAIMTCTWWRHTIGDDTWHLIKISHLSPEFVKYNGSNRTTTISSILFMNLSGSLLTLGVQTPTKNPPKMTSTPMIWVSHAQRKIPIYFSEISRKFHDDVSSTTRQKTHRLKIPPQRSSWVHHLQTWDISILREPSEAVWPPPAWWRPARSATEKCIMRRVRKRRWRWRLQRPRGSRPCGDVITYCTTSWWRVKPYKMSLRAAAESARFPILVSNNLASDKIRAKTGNCSMIRTCD